MAGIKERIIQQIRSELREGKIRNAHGITAENIGDHLIDPIQQTYESDFGGRIHQLDLWTVLEEEPEGRNGYKVFFDPEMNSFGLGYPGEHGKLVYNGSCGTFLDALNAM